MAQREQQARVMEALSRIAMQRDWHEQMGGIAQQRANQQAEYNQERTDLGSRRADIAAQIAELRRQQSAGLFAQHGLRYDVQGNPVAIPENELTPQQRAQLGLTQARTGEATSHANYLDQLPELKRDLEAARDRTMVQIQGMRSQDKELDRALSSQLAGGKAAQQLFLTNMGRLERERLLAERVLTHMAGVQN